MHKADKYELVMVLGREGPARLAANDDVISRKTKPAPGPKQIPLELSPAGISKGLLYVYQQPKTSYLNKPLNNYFQATIYGGENLWDIFYWPILFGLATLPLQLPFSVARDVRRRRELRYGRRLRGPERLTPKEFNQKVQGDGIGIKTDYMKDSYGFPRERKRSTSRSLVTREPAKLRSFCKCFARSARAATPRSSITRLSNSHGVFMSPAAAT